MDLQHRTDLLAWVLGPQCFATLAMTGLIWFVQMVHYPLFARVPPNVFPEYESAHASRTTMVVAPLMLIEAITAALLVVPGLLHTRSSVALAWIGLLLLVVVWASTFLVQVPLHTRLARGFDPKLIDRLVATNWIRTIAWTARGLIVVVITVSSLRTPS